MPKSARQALIRDLLRRGPIPSQATLRRELGQRGIDANQATISRDVKELGLVKTADGYVLPGTDGAAPPRGLRLEHVYGVEPAGSLVVLKTAPGLASPTALELDRAGHPGVVGTVAGDDTIFVATRSARAARQVARQITGGEIA